MRAIDLLGEALVKLREGREERMMLELAVLKLVRSELDDDHGALLRRIEKLEKDRAAAPAAAPARQVPAAGPPTAAPAGRRLPGRAAATGGNGRCTVGGAADRAAGMDWSGAASDLERIWPQLMAGVRDEMGPRRGSLFRERCRAVWRDPPWCLWFRPKTRSTCGSCRPTTISSASSPSGRASC